MDVGPADAAVGDMEAYFAGPWSDGLRGSGFKFSIARVNGGLHSSLLQSLET
jgi:hypothetical protein